MSGRPELRIVRGEPTPEELAVLTAVVSAAAAEGGDTARDDAAGGDAAGPPARRGRWSEPASIHRGSLLPGPGGWRATFR